MDNSLETSESTIKIREKIREHIKNSRHIRRKNEVDALRVGLGDISKIYEELENLTAKDVTGLCSKIKRKKHASKEILFRLSNAFLQTQENITTFIKIQGAIQVIVKELTGNDSEQQIRASETLCNLSIGGALVCEKISLAAGSYFVTYLNSTDIRLKQTNLWIIMNIVATGGKGRDNLLQMELIPKLIFLYISHNENTEIIKDSGIALDLIFSSVEVLRSEDQKLFFDNMHLIKPEQYGSEYHLKIIFEASLISHDFILTNDQIKYLLDFIIFNILNTSDFLTNENVLKILYSVRILSNLFHLYAKSITAILVNSFAVHKTNLIDLINNIFSFNDKILSKECFLLLKNIISCEELKEESKYLMQNIKVKRNFPIL